MEMKLSYKNENKLSRLSEKENKDMFSFCKDYRSFITTAKTEREFCDDAYRLLEKSGFKSLENQENLRQGDKVYSINRGKGIIAAVIGKKDIKDGINMVGAHIDSPRLDLKPNPMYEDSGIAYFKTHYYGGIKKYQWVTVPLSLHGVVVKKDGTQIKISIGENTEDPVFCITDILPHLAQEQMKKKISDAVDGESFNVMIGNTADKNSKETEKVKYNILKLLNQKYDICEEDFLSSELELVPAFPARDIGLDRSMVAGYGQDDRVCAYTALKAILDIEKPDTTAFCILVDKEEIGSMGNTGMQSRHFENILAKICAYIGEKSTDLAVRECLSNSSCLSADVGTAFDPNYPEVSEKNNVALINGGLMLNKYTGARGKSGASDANAEFVAKIRSLFDENNIGWQIGELGKVDLGGGGTIAQFVANLDVDVIDCGVPLMSMHSPYEIAGKYDIYMAYKGYKAFLNQ